MSLPPVVRDRLARLQTISRPLRRPVVWGTLATLGLLAVVAPQYLRHPEWRSQYEPATESATADSSASLDRLNSKDLADLAEIDNLSLLLNQLQPFTSTTLEVPMADSASLALPTPDEGATSHFASYLEQNRFRFSPSVSGNETEAEDAQLPWGQPQSLTSDAATQALPPSAIQQALSQRLQSAPSSKLERLDSPTTGFSSNAPSPDTTDEPILPPWMVEGRLPGVDQRFIRTTPQMSPPPGTTGYTTPPSIVPNSATVAPVTPTQGATAPAALNLDFGAPVTAPAGIVQGQTPPSTIDNSLSAPSPQPSPALFSAPRPPGVYTGNGYINTFANPSGP